MALTDRLSAIGNAIREKNGSTDTYTLAEMPDAIAAIKTGDPELTGNAIVGTLNIPYLYELSTKKSLSDGVYATANLEGTFKKCKQLTNIGPIVANPINLHEALYGCRELKEVPLFRGSLDLLYKSSSDANRMIACCTSLRNLRYPLNSTDGEGAGIHPSLDISLLGPQAFYCCYALDEITNLYVRPDVVFDGTIDYFYDMFYGCTHVKDITFAPCESAVSWTNQHIDLSSRVGHGIPNHNQIGGWISDNEHLPGGGTIYHYKYRDTGINTRKKVQYIGDYLKLKDDPDWWAFDVLCSRYNHDSAVNTINSLPRTTGTGCVITFNSAAGKEIGKEIDDLTEEEIAVAVDKGWTVSFIRDIYDATGAQEKLIDWYKVDIC